MFGSKGSEWGFFFCLEAVPAGTRWEFGVELLSQILPIAMEMAASAGSMCRENHFETTSIQALAFLMLFVSGRGLMKPK